VSGSASAASAWSIFAGEGVRHYRRRPQEHGLRGRLVEQRSALISGLAVAEMLEPNFVAMLADVQMALAAVDGIIHDGDN
jgi:hypothetical protein